MGKHSNEDNFTEEESTTEAFELQLKRQSTGEYSHCSSITYEQFVDVVGFRTTILDSMRHYRQYGEEMKQEDLPPLHHLTSHTKPSMDSELTGLEISTPVAGNRKKVGSELKNGIEDLIFDPKDDSSVLLQELDDDDDDGFTYETVSTRGEKRDSFSLPPPTPPTLDFTSHDTAMSSVFRRYYPSEDLAVHELNLTDEDDEFTSKTISTQFLKSLMDTDRADAELKGIHERTNRLSNRTSDIAMDFEDELMFADDLFIVDDQEYGEAPVSPEPSRALKKKKTIRKLKKDSSSHRSSKKLLVADKDQEANSLTASPRSLKKKSSSSRSLKKEPSSRSLKKEPSSRKLKKEPSKRKGLKNKEPSTRSNKLVENKEESDNSRTLEKSNRSSKLHKSSGSRSEKLLDSQESSLRSVKTKSPSSPRDRLEKISSSRISKQKLLESQEASSSSLVEEKKKKSKRPTLIKKTKSKKSICSSSKSLKEEDQPKPEQSSRSSITKRLSKLVPIKH